MSERFISIQPQDYGRLHPIIPVSKTEWLFQCACGRTKVLRNCVVVSGHVKSCGCILNKGRGLRSFRTEIRKTLLKKQGNHCAICKTEFSKTPQVDHDHRCCRRQKTMCEKCVRGLLCDTCNRGLGMFKDDLELLKAAVKYMEGFQ